ncbi:hypothetical protein PHYSODRAFT_339287 [Phytophthora sojae]|uniref:Uncharacterized protein n=1 Tax=Phytophthora sojae (strain P6497) TaxID=1094619 RepID=G5A6A9_PHYSP|nr:hypothetical protein PHYSODRAFT_339287 [Phytophthora sojae]EGZ08864.1 hypothetical protein PHYSODRAFT_339287 [Phytophthora sojae]|eukprot:XP_009535497.1 hypothetical protein PHYSODRAFT_339287 [Phytophthora sojae]
MLLFCAFVGEKYAPFYIEIDGNSSSSGRHSAIKDAVIFGSGCEFGECQIHVLTLLKNCDVSGDLLQPGKLVNLFEWDDSDCGKVKGIEAVGNVMEFTGPSFYVRKEIRCVLENFKNFLQQKDTSVNSKKQFIFVGSPETGKSCILALICCYLATVEKVSVVLHCCVNTRGDTLATTRLLDEGKYYEWIDVDGEVYKSLRLNGRTIFPGCWYCLDGLDQKQLGARNWSNLYTVLATSRQFEKKGQGGSKQVNCLVPYWRHDDLQRMAAEFPSPDERDVAARYFVSGGNVRDFCLPPSDENDLADALHELNSMNYDSLLSTSGCNSQAIDRIRMMGCTNYADIMREDTGAITFDSSERLQVKREGTTSIDEHVAVMKRWAADPTEMDYWIPESSVCEAIDAAAKWKLLSDSVERAKVGSIVERICFLQVTTDTKCKCDEEVLWEFAKPFLDANKQVCYMVLLCDSGFGMGTDSKEDKKWRFRLEPEEIKMDKIKEHTPVYVAHA